MKSVTDISRHGDVQNLQLIKTHPQTMVFNFFLNELPQKFKLVRLANTNKFMNRIKGLFNKSIPT